MLLTGTTVGQPVAVRLNGSGKYLARVSVRFLVPEDEARETFARLRADLIGKYGTPALDKREFDVAGVPAPSRGRRHQAGAGPVLGGVGAGRLPRQGGDGGRDHEGIGAARRLRVAGVAGGVQEAKAARSKRPLGRNSSRQHRTLEGC